MMPIEMALLRNGCLVYKGSQKNGLEDQIMKMELKMEREMDMDSYDGGDIDNWLLLII